MLCMSSWIASTDVIVGERLNFDPVPPWIPNTTAKMILW